VSDIPVTPTAPPSLDGERSGIDLAWLRRKTEWMISRRVLMIVLLAAAGIAVRNAWITTQPLVAGDWHWPSQQRLFAFSPFPGVWDSTLGLGGENRFLEAFRFDLYAVTGAISRLGATWTFIEKAVYFVPAAVLLPVAGWLLSREIMGRSRWTLLTPLLLVGNTYFMLEADGEVPLVIGEAISFLVLLAFLRAMRTGSPRWAVGTGLLMAATAAFDVRPVYLCAVLMTMYFVIVLLRERNWRLLGRRVLLGAIAGAVFLGSQAFWLVPLLTYHGNPGFPTPDAPNFNILTLGHGLDGVSSFWTGGTPSLLVQAPLNPMYTILPLVALAPLLARRIRPEVVWLALAALLFAFFAKTTTPPFGGVYEWMYLHVPGWKLFREGSKFLYVVGLAYAILIPIALASAVEWAASLRINWRRFAVRAGAAAALAGMVAVSTASIVVLQTSALASTTVPTPEPSSFSQLDTLLAADSRPGPVLWLGQPLVVTGNRSHRFVIASATHPAVDMTGNSNDSEINARDPFQLFCADNAVPFCYVNPELMPYLTQVTGAGYVIVPGGSEIGSLPPGVTRPWLRSQMIASLGPPTTVLGSGATSLVVWRIASPQPVVSTFPAVALVDSGSWATTAVLPALEATGLPAAYRQSFDNVHYPVAPANLPDSVRILPRQDGGCVGSTSATVAVMAQTPGSSLTLDVAGHMQALPLLTSASRLPGWSVFGPLSVGAGLTALTSATPSVTLGPCIAWSPLAASVLGSHSGPVFTTTLSAQGERISATTTNPVAQPWVELLRYEDPGWRLGNEHPTVLGGGLFNLYHLDAAHQQATKLTFAFSTINWELLGRGISAVVVLLAVGVAVWDSRRRRFDSAACAAYRQQVFVASRLARWLAGVGLGLLVVTSIVVTLEWFGVPSLVPFLAVAPDPYNVDVGFGGAAIGVLLLALVVIVISNLFETRLERAPEHAGIPKSAGIAVACVALLCILLSACGSSPGDIQNLLTQAKAAGALAPTVTGQSLDEATLQSQANDAEACIADYTAVLRALPQLLTAYVGRGQCYLSGGNNGAAAVHDFSAAIALEPAQSDLYLDRAVADRVVGNYAAAMADYTSAAFAPIGGASEQLTAVNGLVALGDISAAMTVYRRALQLDPESAALRLAGAAIALASDNDAGANAAVAAGLQLATSSAQMGQVLAAKCHIEVLRQESTLAIATCTQSAQASSPGGSGAYDDLSAAQLAAGNPTAALAAITSSIEAFIADVGPYAQQSGVDGFGLANLYIARAWIQVQLQNLPAAVADFQRALAALPPGSPDSQARIKADIATARADG
jgi:tetratricopeptide (TPR) repeat protein